jgi:ankyrin repeat protein
MKKGFSTAGDDVRRLITFRAAKKLEVPYAVSCICIFAALLATLSANAATNELTDIMQKALFEEEGNHNLPAAIEGYQNIITRFDESRALTATAVFRLGECYRKQGRTNEAAAQYQRIVRDFGDQTTLVSLSQQNLSALGQAGEPVVRTQVSGASLSPASGSLPQAVPSPTLEEDEIRRIRAMIKDSPDLINARDASTGETPLHRAIKQSHINVIEFLLSNGAAIEAKDNAGNTALHVAAETGNKAVVESLLHKKADARATNRDGWTPLHFAAEKGFRAIAELLIESGADINAKDSRNATPMHLAVANGYRAVAELLISRKANLGIAGTVSSPGFNNLAGTPLHIAVARNDEPMARLLLDSKAPVDGLNGPGETPLDNAAAAGNTDMVKLLLENGANPNSKNPRGGNQENWTPLHYAAGKVQAGKVQKGAMALLLSSKADPNARAPRWFFGNEQKRDYTPLLMAARFGDGATVELLLANGADPNLTGLSAETPLINLIRSGHASEPEQLRGMKALLEHGADPNASTGNNFTPLMMAASDPEKDIVRLLIDHKADLNARTTDQGMTALNLITQRPKNSDFLAIAKMLLDAGADVNLPNAYGKTPLSLIRSSDEYWVQMADLFRKYGAVTDVPDFNSLRLRRKGGETVVVFRQDTNKVNHFTLFQIIVEYYNNPGGFKSQSGAFGTLPSGGLFPFPDLSQLKIIRPVKGSLTKSEDSPAYVLNDQNGFDCSKDRPLQFGDVIEIPAREHPLNEAEVGLTEVQSDTLRGCLTQKVTFKAKSGAIELPGVSFSHDNNLSGAMKLPQVQSLLTSASDLRNVKIKRVDRETHATRELIEDVQSFWENKRSPSDDIRLRDGDIVEVPDK